MADERWRLEDGGLNWFRLVGPEMMAAQSDYLPQHIDRFAWLNGVRNDFWVRRNSKIRELSDGARRPGLVSHLVKPPLRLAVMNVVRPGKRDQDIAIKQVNRQMSSSLRRTSSLVSGRAPADTSNTGNPFLAPRPRFCGASPRRASSDKAFQKKGMPKTKAAWKVFSRRIQEDAMTPLQ